MQVDIRETSAQEKKMRADFGHENNSYEISDKKILKKLGEF